MSNIRFARIPKDGQLCEFCLMLASRGFVYHSAKSAGGNGHHYHANCRCIVMPGTSKTKVEGYNPGELYAQWRSIVGNPIATIAKAEIATGTTITSISQLDEVQKFAMNNEMTEEEKAIFDKLYSERYEQLINNEITLGEFKEELKRKFLIFLEKK